MNEEVVFNHTLHKKFWKTIAQGIDVGSYYGDKSSAILYGLNNNLLSTEDVKELISSDTICMACIYDEKCRENDIESEHCDHCPLVVTDNVIQSLPKEYRTNNDGCLHGLYDYFCLCAELANFIDMLEQTEYDYVLDEKIRHIMLFNTNWKPMYYMTNKEDRWDRRDILHFRKLKLIKSLRQIARTIANLPVAPGVIII